MKALCCQLDHAAVVLHERSDSNVRHGEKGRPVLKRHLD